MCLLVVSLHLSHFSKLCFFLQFSLSTVIYAVCRSAMYYFCAFRSVVSSWHFHPYLRPVKRYFCYCLVFLQLTIVAFSWVLCKVINRPPLAVPSRCSNHLFNGGQFSHRHYCYTVKFLSYLKSLFACVLHYEVPNHLRK